MYAKLGDKGSVVLPYRPTGVVWKCGGEGKPTWYVRANHGGGYSYRLCKYEPGVNVTEACFQQTPLDFTNESRIVWRNGSSQAFTPTLLSEGTTPKGSMWAMNPIPASSSDYPAPCPHPGGPVRAPTAYLHWGANPTDCSGVWPTTLYIEDTVKVSTYCFALLCAWNSSRMEENFNTILSRFYHFSSHYLTSLSSRIDLTSSYDNAQSQFSTCCTFTHTRTHTHTHTHTHALMSVHRSTAAHRADPNKHRAWRVRARLEVGL